jgi:hypothetical protein
MQFLNKKLAWVLAMGALMAGAPSCNSAGGDGSSSALPGVPSSGSNGGTSQTTDPASTPTSVDPSQKHVFIVVLENTDASSALQQPFLSQLASRGALLTNYNAITHPSQPNYIGLTSGGTQGIADDNNHTVDVRNIADLIEEKGLTWKSYAEGYPGGCNLSASVGTYYRKHEPFLSYQNIQSAPARCANIVNSSQLAKDIAAGTLPNYSFYVPDINDDGHDTGVAYADNWLSTTFSSLLNDPNFMKNNLFIVTFDEGDQANLIYTVLYGDSVQAGATSSQATGHYGLLTTIEQYLGLGSLGQADATAQPITGIWK